MLRLSPPAILTKPFVILSSFSKTTPYSCFYLLTLVIIKYETRMLRLQMSGAFHSYTILIPRKVRSDFLSSRPRPISTPQLNALLHLHPEPINLVVFQGSYFFRMGYLILRGASRLDAFSVYPFPTWLLCYALGKTTDSPEVSPSRSSRTKDSSSQISCAHDG